MIKTQHKKRNQCIILSTRSSRFSHQYKYMAKISYVNIGAKILLLF